MRLFEHPDFEQAILQAAEHFRERNLRPAIIEKDYYVTEALRVIAATSTGKIIFKGGTSLAKGWNLIQRFSEDIDIFLDPTAFQPALGKNAIDRELKKLRDAVGQHPALSFVESESQTIGGFGRNDRFSYAQRFGGTGEVANRVLLEAGTASGREPSATIEFRSQLAKLQTGFVDEPRRAVEDADKLVAAVMQRLAEGFANERSGLEKQWDRGDNVSTEDLRVALQRYRSFFDRLLKLGRPHYRTTRI